MAKWRLVLTSLIVLVIGLPAGAIGGADDAPRVGMPEWAAGPRPESPLAAHHEGTVGQALGGGVGLSEQVRARLTDRETLGAGVGLSDSLRARLMTQGALGTASGAPSQIQERLMNRANVGAAVGMPQQVRERLMAMVGSQ